MIVLSGKKKVDLNQYDHVWYVTTTNPGMRVGCEHHPELAAPMKLHTDICRGLISEEEFCTHYVKMLRTPEKQLLILDLVSRSEMGEWFQLIFYEDDMRDGERKYFYEILKEHTENVRIE